MTKFFKLLFFSTLISSTLIVISSYSWLSMWIGLEINLLSIIPLLKSNMNVYPSEAAFKYFITQALASSILLFSIILTLNMNENLFFDLAKYNLILNSALFLKIGIAPFHSWFPEVAEGLNWANNSILFTWQKIAPMIILFYSQNNSFFLQITIILSSVIGGILGLNQTSLRKILAYSSINHMSWMMSSMLYSQFTWLIYFFVYSFVTLSIILIFTNLKIYQTLQLFQSLLVNKNMKFSLLMNFLSLGGLPPFLGFLPKWLVINNLINNNFILISLILIVMTLITLFFYLRLILLGLTLMSSEILLKKNTFNNNLVMIFNFTNLIGILACTLMFNYI
uniref:NADH-ubiquinone oxidoreductase chain 2 n=1 Tax=Cerambycidae sp. 7 KM-2017 TaxID=2219292 RepID=A0A346RI14_9CUCU|nr:NADH dehydrogenase subunit 2 [Cerambycidae sp. 7 KM-2017]